MSAPVDRWKLGLFVLTGFGALVGSLTFAGMAQLQRPSKEAFAYFDEPVVGLEPGSSVRFRGVPIGVVDDITLASNKKHLQVRMALYDDKLVKLGLEVDELGPDKAFPSDLRAQLVTQYITQMSFVLVDFVVPGSGCRFSPTCSAYALECLARFGLLRGGCLACKRICRCHPWGGSGVDAPPER